MKLVTTLCSSITGSELIDLRILNRIHSPSLIRLSAFPTSRMRSMRSISKWKNGHLKRQDICSMFADVLTYDGQSCMIGSIERSMD
ncbi:hypothetical protein COOONC_05844 [Cooperia oncophora]